MTTRQIRASKDQHKRALIHLRDLVRSGTPTRISKGFPGNAEPEVQFVFDYTRNGFVRWQSVVPK